MKKPPPGGFCTFDHEGGQKFGHHRFLLRFQHMALDILPALLSRRERRAREDVNEEDLLAAVQRHRMEKLQAELKRLQGGATSGR